MILPEVLIHFNIHLFHLASPRVAESKCRWSVLYVYPGPNTLCFLCIYLCIYMCVTFFYVLIYKGVRKEPQLAALLLLFMMSKMFTTNVAHGRLPKDHAAGTAWQSHLSANMATTTIVTTTMISRTITCQNHNKNQQMTKTKQTNMTITSITTITTLTSSASIVLLTSGSASSEPKSPSSSSTFCDLT